MNTAIRSTVATTLFATIATALALTATQSPAQQAPAARAQAAAASTVIHQLPRVVVTGHVQRAEAKIVDLPRVVMVVRRADGMETRLSQANVRAVAPRS